MLTGTVKRWGFAVAAACVSAPGMARAQETVALSKLDLTMAVQGFGAPRADRSVDGHTLTLQGKTYSSGFGTHSPGILVVDLHGKAQRFTADVGIDDEVPAGRGSAEFEVLGAGNRILWRSGVLRRGDAPAHADVALAGLQRIILRVTTGGDGFEFDHADWADAVFTYAGEAPRTAPWKRDETEPVIAKPLDTGAPRLLPPYVFGVRAGTPLLWTPAAAGRRPLRFSAKSLPPGVTLDPETGSLAGRIAKAGDYAVRVTIRSAAGTESRAVHLVASNVIAATPPMGWNSYDAYGDSVTEAEMLANARYMQARMLPYGWDTVVVDYRWYDASPHANNSQTKAFAPLTMDSRGRLLPAPNRFPSAADGSGFRALAAQVHKMGLKFGIHIMRGIPRNAVVANLPIEGSPFRASDAADTHDTCPWCPDMYGVRGATPAGQAYYDSLFRLYASWGVDIVKMDDTSAPYHTPEIEAVRHAIDRCGRSIIYSLSPGETPIVEAKHVAEHANMWRGLGDLWDDWGPLNHAFEVGARWTGSIGPGHWLDPDMLPLGRLSVGGRSVGADRRSRFSKPEQMTLLSLWAMLPAPLMVGGDLPSNDPWTLALLTNADILGIDQDSLAVPGKPILTREEWQIWSRPLADGSVAVGLFNRSDFEGTLTVTAADLGLSGRFRYRDLWQGRDRGALPPSLTVTAPAHGAVMYRLTRMPGRPDRAGSALPAAHGHR